MLLSMCFADNKETCRPIFGTFLKLEESLSFVLVYHVVCEHRHKQETGAQGINKRQELIMKEERGRHFSRKQEKAYIVSSMDLSGFIQISFSNQYDCK